MSLVGPILPNQLAGMWHKVSSLLEPLCADVRHGITLKSLADNLLRGNYQLWVLGDFDAAITTRFRVLDDGRRLLVINMAGGVNVVHNIPEILQTFENYAKMTNCSAMEVIGRKGWEKLGRDLDFQHYYTSVYKEI